MQGPVTWITLEEWRLWPGVTRGVLPGERDVIRVDIKVLQDWG